MTSLAETDLLTTPLPDHTQLPESDGTFVKNDQEHPQSILLTDSLLPVLLHLHPDGNYCVGQDLGIYWRVPAPGDRPERCAVAPDWFYVPDVPRMLSGRMRRSYVLWQELIAPLVLAEFVSGSGAEERDRTPHTGEFWIYEQVIHASYYAIHEADPGRVEVHQLIGGRFARMEPNVRGHFEIPPLGVELGIWQGKYMDAELPWLRWWDLQGNLLLTGHERAAQSEQRAERLAAQLRALGAEPEA